MGSHLVHIYYREPDSNAGVSPEVFGVVEDIEGEMRYPFTNSKELWDILVGNLTGLAEVPDHRTK